MKKVVVIYKSKYGSTKQYAEWIAEALGGDLFEVSKMNAELVQKYDTVLFGGGLYASGINGIAFIKNNFDALKAKTIAVFTVGLADPLIKEQFQPILDKNFTEEMKNSIQFFHLRGGINYKKLGLVHKSMMAMLKATVKNKKEEMLSDDDKLMLETYGDSIDFTDKATIEPILSFVNNRAKA